MKKKHKYLAFNLGTLIALCGVFCFAYYLLLNDSLVYISLTDIIDRSNELSLAKHLFVLGLVPIYIAIVIFGAATIGFYLGAIIQRVVIEPLTNLTLSALRAKS